MNLQTPDFFCCPPTFREKAGLPGLWLLGGIILQRSLTLISLSSRTVMLFMAITGRPRKNSGWIDSGVSRSGMRV